MRAAIAGDIIGSRFERSVWGGGAFPDVRCTGYDVEPRHDSTGEPVGTFELFHPACHTTDDAILTVAVMGWLLHGGDLSAALRAHFRRSDRPELFGKLFREWASRDDDRPCGSFGNGSAMRVSPVAFAADEADEVLRLARASAEPTHNTPEALAGTEAVALGVFLARSGAEKGQIADEIAGRFGYDLATPLDRIRPGYRFTSACSGTVPIAFRAFLESAGYEETLRRAISVGGDSDTIACMAGALAGAFWGIPVVVAGRVLESLGPEMGGAVLEFEARYPASLRIAPGGDAWA
jgi:ADP-ribosylglycohydrolase